MEAWALAGALIAGVDWRLIGLAAAVLFAPLPSAVALGVVVAVGRRAEARARSGREVRFAESVIGELQAGASPRAALRSACGDLPGAARIMRLLDIGEPLPRAVEGLAPLLPSLGPLVETAVSVGGGGGRFLPIFEELMVHAAAHDEAAAEVRTALAPVRASMGVLVTAPLVYLLWSLSTGRLVRLLALPGGMWLALVGSGLLVGGVVTMVVLARTGR